jgi:hypothetical protein
MKDLNSEKEFVLLNWISTQGMKFNSTLQRDKARKMKEILDSKSIQSWITEID